MREWFLYLFPYSVLVFLSGCVAQEGNVAYAPTPGYAPSPGMPQSDIDARLAAADRCEARGLKAPSKEYSECFFSGLHESSSATTSLSGPDSGRPSPQELPSPSALPTEFGPASNIGLQRQGGTYVVPASINGRLTLDFVVDSGASDVSIPADVVLTLIRTRTIDGSDFIGHQSYRLADGSVVPSITFRIRTLEVGGHEVANVVASVAPMSGELLLGQSFLGRFKSWSIDNHRHVLLLN